MPGGVLSSPQPAPGLPLLIRMHDGTVAVPAEGGSECYTDVNGVENWLLDLAWSRGRGPLLRELGR